MKPEHLIFRITSIMRAVEQSLGLGDLDLSCRSILVFVGEAEAARMKLNVADIIRTSSFGTPPTVYARLSELHSGGWIEYAPDPHDRRARQVLLTQSARRVYRKVSREVLKFIEEGEDGSPIARLKH